jgi:hypothetical protein
VRKTDTDPATDRSNIHSDRFATGHACRRLVRGLTCLDCFYTHASVLRSAGIVAVSLSGSTDDYYRTTMRGAQGFAPLNNRKGTSLIYVMCTTSRSFQSSILAVFHILCYLLHFFLPQVVIERGSRDEVEANVERAGFGETRLTRPSRRPAGLVMTTP